MAKPQQQSGATAPAKAARKRTVKADAVGQVHINATFNNVIITFTNNSGQTVAWSSAGKMGFRGAKKNTPFAAQVAAQDVSKMAFDHGIRKVKVYIKGPGAGRDSAIRNIGASGIEITEIMDITPLPHNGCRPPKRRKM
ncbi:MAG TPA: 30S ribosomal protein S11 [Bacteroidia bacterium]|jgi:small subunit ribosomal protein S11|nr:30S ribosomal protein S11 [Bacteroidia bacterium]